MKAAYENAPADKRCKIEGGLLAYLLRYEPDYAVNQLKVGRGCAYDAFPTHLKIHRWKEVEPSVIAELNAPNPAASPMRPTHSQGTVTRAPNRPSGIACAAFTPSGVKTNANLAAVWIHR